MLCFISLCWSARSFTPDTWFERGCGNRWCGGTSFPIEPSSGRVVELRSGKTHYEDWRGCGWILALHNLDWTTTIEGSRMKGLLGKDWNWGHGGLLPKSLNSMNLEVFHPRNLEVIELHLDSLYTAFSVKQTSGWGPRPVRSQKQSQVARLFGWNVFEDGTHFYGLLCNSGPWHTKRPDTNPYKSETNKHALFFAPMLFLLFPPIVACCSFYRPASTLSVYGPSE